MGNPPEQGAALCLTGAGYVRKKPDPGSPLHEKVSVGADETASPVDLDHMEIVRTVGRERVPTIDHRGLVDADGGANAPATRKDALETSFTTPDPLNRNTLLQHYRR